ncbi:hypothetical protein GCM10010407_19460 [Rarobacter incanus]
MIGGLLSASLLAQPAAAIAAPAAPAASQAAASVERIAATFSEQGRTVSLIIDDEARTGRVRVTGAQGGDAAWMDYSTTGFTTHTGRVNYTNQIANGTLTSAPRSDHAGTTAGLLRACANINNQAFCTGGSRSATTDLVAAVNGIDYFYDSSTGLFDADPTGKQPAGAWVKWWQSAVAVSALVQSAKLLPEADRAPVLARIDQVYQANRGKDTHGFGDNFRNDFIDDTGWWAIAWFDAYQLTGNQDYLATSKVAADFMSQWWNTDSACGGLYWQLEKKDGVWVGKSHLSAISNSLYLRINAELFRATGEQKYLDRATQEWQWFTGSGLIGADGLVKDGVNRDSCEAGGTAYTYNQGSFISGAVEYYRATGDQVALDKARQVANATTTSTALNLDGYLFDDCEKRTQEEIDASPNEYFGYRCKNDGPTFKGPAIRGLGELNQILADQPFSAYIARQWDSARSSSVSPRLSTTEEGAAVFGLRWFDGTKAPTNDTDTSNAALAHIGNQAAALMLANAADAPAALLPTLAVSASQAASASGWYPLGASFSATSSLPGTVSMLQDGAWVPLSSPKTYSEGGEYQLTLRAPDSSRVVNAQIKIDGTAPVATAQADAARHTFTISASDGQSGVAAIEYSIAQGPWKTYSTPVHVPEANTSIAYRAIDQVGNVSATKSVTTADVLETSITVSATTVEAGTSAKLGITVAAIGSSVVPTGTVEVSAGATRLGAAELSNGKATISLPRTLAQGTHRLTVYYGGSSTVAATSVTVDVVIKPASDPGTGSAGVITIIVNGGAASQVGQTTARANVALTVRAPKSVRASKRAKVRISAKAKGTKVTGKVTVRVKRIAIAKGQTKTGRSSFVFRVKLRKQAATLKLPRLKPGTYQVTASVKKSSSHKKATSKTIKVRVKR